MTRAKEVCDLHNRELDDVISDALDYWLATVGETETEQLLEKSLESGARGVN